MDWTTNKIQRICLFCGKSANQEHHFFSQTIRNRLTYGNLIDEAFNKCPACSACNTSHQNIPPWAIWDEKTFRERAKEQGHNLPVGTTSFKNLSLELKS